MMGEAMARLFPDAAPGIDYLLQDDSDGRGPYIREWHLEVPEPSAEELAAAIAAVEAEDARSRSRVLDLVRFVARIPSAKRQAIFTAVRGSNQLFLGWSLLLVQRDRLDLDDPLAQAFVQGLATAGAITQEEADGFLG